MNEKLKAHLLAEGIEKLTPIQEKAIPAIMEGNDVLGISPTGTGKTYAYLIPVIERLDMSINKPQAVILAPTHELCAQVYKVADALVKCLGGGEGAALLIGGANIKRQLEKLKGKPKVIVGSSGRVLEIIKLKKLSGHYIKTIVVDEADRMLDEQNIGAVTDIIRTTLRDRQLLFFTASAGQEVLNKAQELSGERFTIVNGSEEISLPEKIRHMYLVCEGRDKFELLRKIAHAEKIERGIVFVNKSDNVDFLAKRLNYHGISASALHGQAFGEERRAVISGFREGRINLLVASDLAARGLDIPEITHIISMDVPEEPSFYLHRAGRTGRMNRDGVSITLVEERDLRGLKKIEKTYGIVIAEKKIRLGKIMDI